MKNENNPRADGREPSSPRRARKTPYTPPPGARLIYQNRNKIQIWTNQSGLYWLTSPRQKKEGWDCMDALEAFKFITRELNIDFKGSGLAFAPTSQSASSSAGSIRFSLPAASARN